MLRGQVLHWRTSSQNLTPFPHAVEVMTAKRGQSELTPLSVRFSFTSALAGNEGSARG